MRRDGGDCRQPLEIVPVRVVLLPFGPVVVRVPVQLPPEHEAVPDVVTVLPLEPVRVVSRVHVPPLQLPLTVVVIEPLGPVTEPVRVQALAPVDAARVRRPASAESAMNLFMSVSLNVFAFTFLASATFWRLKAACLGHIAVAS